MKDWKIIIGLILVIIVLLVSLGFKVMNNTPENQMQEFTNNYNEQKLENNLNDIKSNLYLLNKLNTTYEKSGLDKVLYDLGKYYKWKITCAN